MTYLTEEQQDLIDEVNEKHVEEFDNWAEENKPELMKWFAENISIYDSIVDNCKQFAYYVADRFMKYKMGVRAEE